MNGPQRPSRHKPMWIGAGVVGAVLLIAGISSRDDSTLTSAPSATTAARSTTSAVPTQTSLAAPPQLTVAAPPKLTRAPITQAPATPRQQQSRPASRCDPNYSGCVPVASDVDCQGGSGNGPAYVRGPVRVIGSDVYGLDADDDGIGCE